MKARQVDEVARRIPHAFGRASGANSLDSRMQFVLRAPVMHLQHFFHPAQFAFHDQGALQLLR